MYADSPGAQEEKWVFATQVTFVRVDHNGESLPLPDDKV